MLARKLMRVKGPKGPCFSVVRSWASLPEYTEEPEYPPILDLSNEARLMRKEDAYYDEIRALETVEEKLMKINMPKYYGWKCVGIYENLIPYGARDFAQYATRTYLHKTSDIPKINGTSDLLTQCEHLSEELQNSVEDAIVIEHMSERNEVEESEKINLGERIILQINRVILDSLMKEFPHLLTSQIQSFPRLESFWNLGGILPVKNKKPEMRDLKLQFFGNPIVHLRHEYPLLPLTEWSEIQDLRNDIPNFKYDPRVLRYKYMHRHVTNIPGFWPGDIAEYPLMSFHSMEHLQYRKVGDNSDALDVQAIFASYAWLQAVATYQGFTTFHDITYPLVTQTVLSDGQHWSFYLYQLNTTLLHSRYIDENSLCNVCWGSDMMQLYEKVEDGHVIGFNKEVLKTLLCLYLNAPQPREGTEMKPYLGSNTKLVADIDHDERRIFLEKHFKHMFSNCKRHRLPYEVYHWEKIYKIDHNTRPMEARRRPFELFQNPWARRYDDHVPVYIPKAQREHKKIKWEKTYYP